MGTIVYAGTKGNRRRSTSNNVFGLSTVDGSTVWHTSTTEQVSALDEFTHYSTTLTILVPE